MRTVAVAALLGLCSPIAFAADETLSTTTAAGNSSGGNMFALTATADVEITGFLVYIGYIEDTSVGCDWEVYTSSSDYTTVYNDSTQWTLVDSGTYLPSTSGDELFDVTLASPVSISSGSSTSFYVTLTDDPYCSVNYTNGTIQGSTYASDSNLSIDEGYGIAYPFIGYFSPRIFNGGIYYRACDDGYLDTDGDGFGDAATYDCHFEGTVVADDTDCDDADGAIYPGATETWYDGVDADCGGDSDYDADMDGHDSSTYSGDDCDDEAPEINPSAMEIWYDGVDSDCDGGSDYDADLDGYDSSEHEGEDCDDASADINPGATETWYDGIDADCAGDNDYDADADGYASADHEGDDCDDAEATTNPAAEETWYDGVDADCAGDSDYDADMDGFDAEEHGGEDCDDTTPDVNPDAEDVPEDTIDQDCDGADATSGGGDGGDGADGADGGDGADGAGEGEDGAGSEGGEDGGGKGSCASAGGEPSSLLWLLGGLGLVGLGRRRD